MGTAPTRRISATVAAALAATLLAGVGASPALGRARAGRRMPVATSARTLGTAAVPSPTLAGRSFGTMATPVRRVVRTSSPTDPVAAQVVRLVNVARADAGCAPLHVDARLATAARLHSEDMARQNYFSHTSLDGRSPWDRMARPGLRLRLGREHRGGLHHPGSGDDGWMNSSGHRANILNCSNKAIGVGVGKGGTYGIYWTQDFGTA